LKVSICGDNPKVTVILVMGGELGDSWAQHLRVWGLTVFCEEALGGFSPRERPSYSHRTVRTAIRFALQLLHGCRKVIEMLWRADIIHFFNGSTWIRTFAPLGYRGWKSPFAALRFISSLLVSAIQELEFAAYRIFGIKVVMSWIGDDLRQGALLSQYSVSTLWTNEYSYWPASDWFKRHNAQFLESRGVRSLIHDPGLVPMHPSYPKYGYIPWPYDGRVRVPVDDQPYLNSKSGRLHILHAPASRDSKGTVYVREAIEVLYSKGFEFTYEEITGATHFDVDCAIQRADIVIDQVLSGWYGSFALEAMYCGKVVVAYIRPSDLSYVSSQQVQDLGVISASPSDLVGECVRLLSLSRQQLTIIGQRNYAYACKWHELDQSIPHFTTGYMNVLNS
jgi:hypothetical protein